MAFVPYKYLSSAQKTQIQSLRPHLTEDQLVRFQYWVKPDGTISRKSGHHTLTKESQSEIMNQINAPARSKGDLQDYKSCDFSMAPES